MIIDQKVTKTVEKLVKIWPKNHWEIWQKFDKRELQMQKIEQSHEKIPKMWQKLLKIAGI